METYTKEQLVQAQLKYNKEFAENPANFQPDTYMIEHPERAANEYVDYLLSLVDEKL